VVSHRLPQNGAGITPYCLWHKDLHAKSVSHPKQAYGQESLASTGRSDSAAFCSDWLLSLREGEQLRVLVEAESSLVAPRATPRARPAPPVGRRIAAAIIAGGMQFVPQRLRGFLRAAVFLERQVGKFFKARGLVLCSLNADNRIRASRRRDVFVCVWYSWLYFQNAKIEMVRWMTQNMAMAPTA